MNVSLPSGHSFRWYEWRVNRGALVMKCSACNNTGLNTLGHSCRICQYLRQREANVIERPKHGTEACAAVDRMLAQSTEECRIHTAQWQRDRDAICDLLEKVKAERDERRNAARDRCNERDVAIKERDDARKTVADLEQARIPFAESYMRTAVGRLLDDKAHVEKIRDQARTRAFELQQQLNLTNEEVDRLKLALSQASGPHPPFSWFELAAQRLLVEGRAWGRGLMLFARWFMRPETRGAPMVFVAMCAAVMLAVMVTPSGGKKPFKPAPIQCDVAPVDTGGLTLVSGTANIYRPTRGGSSIFATSCDAQGAGRVELVMVGAHGAASCWHCGHALEQVDVTRCSWAGEVRIAQDGGTVFDGCAWCVVERLKKGAGR